jgi:hypothetical protein
MFQAFFEFTFIPVAIRPSVYTIPISFTLSPLSYVRISFSSSPNPWSMFQTIYPFSLI